MPGRLADPCKNWSEVASSRRVGGKHTDRLLEIDGTDLLELAPNCDSTCRRVGRHPIHEQRKFGDGARPDDGIIPRRHLAVLEIPDPPVSMYADVTVVTASSYIRLSY